MNHLMSPSLNELDSPDSWEVISLREKLIRYMIHVVGRNPEAADKRDWFYAVAYILRGILSERRIKQARAEQKNNGRRVYYLSMEYLVGRNLAKALSDLALTEPMRLGLKSLGQDLDELFDYEVDAGLGNGGLGRLAACILDSIATQSYAGMGYGIRYEFGMFQQEIQLGEQVEKPENWLKFGNPWEYQRNDLSYPIRFNGKMLQFKDQDGHFRRQWVDTDEIIAAAYDIPISGYHSKTVANLRLWSARSPQNFDLRVFNEGHYLDAVRDKTLSENLSKVLYPNDSNPTGRELRLKQEYFFVSASLQDILKAFLKLGNHIQQLPEKAAIHLNDTHPSLAIPELMRILLDEHGLDFDNAWDITRHTFSYTNHTLLPEALETWPIELLERVLPRHLSIIYDINQCYLDTINTRHPGDSALLKRLSLVDDQFRQIRMANLCVAGSFKVNGVAKLHTQLMRDAVFKDFNIVSPEKITNITNGITPRRWLLQANPQLAHLISQAIGDHWITHLTELEQLIPLADDVNFRRELRQIKRQNKERLAQHIKDKLDLTIDPSSLFDIQVKRIHEYKRQLLNLMHVIACYRRIKEGTHDKITPRTFIFAGKSAPGYFMAKRVIHLIHDVARVVNRDPEADDLLKVIFLPNYNVSEAECIIPACDLSEQISTAGTEASGTGNMKFALNGALTIGTLDGANIEILNAVGENNIFIFGHTAEEVASLRQGGYDPQSIYRQNEELRGVLDMIRDGFFSPSDHQRHHAIINALLREGDHYMLLADFADYIACQKRVDTAFFQSDEWARSTLLNIANMGNFSIDRTVHDYATKIWRLFPMIPQKRLPKMM
ncbi:glycogen/starch/alpha-glucan phosphorylase [Magnetococcales bacterium HHB-1]